MRWLKSVQQNIWKDIAVVCGSDFGADEFLLENGIPVTVDEEKSPGIAEDASSERTTGRHTILDTGQDYDKTIWTIFNWMHMDIE